MNVKTFLVTAALANATLGAVAHADSDDPTIQARQQAMKTISQNFKTVSDTAKGTVDFDAAAIQAALTTISETAAEVPALFEAEVVDAESDASDDIWANWDDFVTKAAALENAAAEASGMVTSADDLSAVMGSVGGACGACHKPYKL
ncbi:MAG: cytochrome c [Pseudomonadota bacterium]|nr:cytochrome c [Pseudomonadota bacterium]